MKASDSVDCDVNDVNRTYSDICDSAHIDPGLQLPGAVQGNPKDPARLQSETQDPQAIALRI